jgi:hypothetical protein
MFFVYYAHKLKKQNFISAHKTCKITIMMLNLLILSFLLIICSVRAGLPVDKVVFSWVDDSGVTQSVTDTSAPWALPTMTGDNKYQPLTYLSTPGKKRIIATAFAIDQQIKTQILEFEIINSNEGRTASKRCSNLITNSDMASGYQGYWKTINGGKLSNMNETLGSPGTAMRYTPSLFTNAGIRYRSKQNIDRTCLAPDTTYEVTTQLLLIPQLTTTTDGTCTVGVDCPRVGIIIVDNTGNTIIDIKSQDYTDGSWDDSGLWNTLTSRFTLPSQQTWDGSVKSVQIDITGFSRFMDLVVDNFSIVPVTDSKTITNKNLLRRVI